MFLYISQYLGMMISITSISASFYSRTLLRLELSILTDVIFTALYPWRIHVRFMTALKSWWSSHHQVRNWLQWSLSGNRSDFSYVWSFDSFHRTSSYARNVSHSWIYNSVGAGCAYGAIGLIYGLVKEALRQQDFRRLWFWSLVCALRVASNRSVARCHHALLLRRRHSVAVDVALALFDVMTWNGGADVLSFACSGYGWRGWRWLLLLVSASLLLRNKWRSWLL